MRAPRTKLANLPLQLTSFIGRERQLADLRQLLVDVRLLTLIGPGGVGKTRLAFRLASELADTMPDGVWLVELAALHDARFVAQAVAAALDIRQEPGERLRVTLQHVLRDRELLLVLDNCEHLVAACADIASDLLRGCPQLRILATSREPLGVVGETTWRVPSMELPDASARSGADEIAASEAARLFAERCRMVVPDFVVTDRNAAGVAQICRRLDGIPLAIELAASRIGALGVDQILARLDQRFRLLKLDLAGLPARHRTLRATVEWSHDLLSQAECVLFRRLAVFSGGWSLEAAEAVCSSGDLARDEVLDLLAKLVDRSLVLVDNRGGVARYTLLETLRQFAQEQLDDAGEREAVSIQHLSWCVNLAESGAPKLNTPDQTSWLEVFDREHDNLRAALTWSLHADRINQCLRLAVACGYFWEIRGHRHRAEGLRWLEQAVSHPGADGAPPSLRAQALYWAGTYASELFQFESATALLGASLTLWTELGDTRGMADTLLSLGVAARVRGEYGRSAEALDRALALMQDRGEGLGIAQVQRQRGTLARVAAQLDEAETRSLEALRIFQSFGELHQVGHVEIEIGELARNRRALQRAAGLYAHGAALLTRAGCQEGVSSACVFEARLARDRGKPDEAYARVADALTIIHEGGSQREMPMCLDVLASLSATTDPWQAVCLSAAADALRSAMGAGLHRVDQADYQRTLELAKSRLSEDAFAQACDAGRAMSMEDAIKCALEARPLPADSASKRVTTGLSARECEVAALIGRGLSNREIAEALVIADRTAETHVTHVLNKLGLRSRAQVAVWAVEHGLVNY